jgi:DNA repair exonuclease SbcCD ATPase subunit
MSLFGFSEKKEIERLKAQLSPEQNQLDYLAQKIKEARAELQSVQNQVKEAKKQIIETDEAALLQSFGIYTPHYSYTTSDEYKDKLKEVRDKQKALVKSGKAVAGNENWKVNGSLSQGKKMVRDMQKLLLRAYNAECDDAIEHVRFNNIEACTKKN